MAQIEAEFQDKRRIVFTSRDRSFVNVRDMRDDGPIGFSSGELLLMALGNCSLGTLLNHEIFDDISPSKVTASLESIGEANPSRMSAINVNIEIEVDEESLQGREATLERIADNCPIGNTLRFTPEVEVKVKLISRGKSSVS
jgi:uncharacterized OsmC-like protein